MAVALAPAAAHVVVTSTTPVTVVPAVSQSTTAATVSSTPAATPSAAGAALSQKKSIFGTMFGSSKKNAPTPTSAGPVAALAGSGEMKKPATATSAHPAMVDAIIKSAKAAESAATALTTVPATAAKAETVAVAAKMQTPLEVKEPVSLSTSTGKPVALKDAMSSKSLISSIVSNYNNALKSGNNAVHGGDSSGPLSAAAPSTAAAAPPVLRDITTTTNASGSSVKAAPAPTAAAASVAVAATPATPSAARPVTAVAASVTPAAAAAASNVPKEYVIEDRDSSDESGTDGEGEESEEAKKKKQNIPDWARGPMLKEALERQYGLNGHVRIRIICTYVWKYLSQCHNFSLLSISYYYYLDADRSRRDFPRGYHLQPGGDLRREGRDQQKVSRAALSFFFFLIIITFHVN